MQALKNRIALVTGANKGIGFEIARQLGEEGIRILVGARDPHRGEAAAAELRSKGLAVRYVQIDLTDPVTISDAVADIEAHEKRLDILINNAAITSAGDGAPSAANIEAVRRTFDTNFFGTLAVTQSVLSLLSDRPQAVSSMSPADWALSPSLAIRIQSSVASGSSVIVLRKRL